MLRSDVFLTTTKETSMSIDTNQPTHETPAQRQPRRRRNLLVAAGAFVAVFAAIAVVATVNTGDDSAAASEDPAAVLADYLEVWNAEDAEAVMVFYTEDAVLEDHPSHPRGGLATGTVEILAVERTIDGHQGSTGTMEFLNIEVSGDTVTFDNIFINRDGQCYSSTGSVMTVEGDKIALIVWGDTDADLC
jgi:ketosteroid isomerase-like protein